jgi:hypothetical protein
MKPEFVQMIPVLPSADVKRDIAWYRERAGFECWWHNSDGAFPHYAVLWRENLVLHLQWHADTPDDPLLGGSVVRIEVKNIQPLFEEFVGRGTVTPDKFREKTPWGTNEFGFFDPNNNAIFLFEDLE